MAQKWFVSRGERILGPWSTEDVFTHRREGNVGDADVIWGAGQIGWITLGKWSPDVSENSNAVAMFVTEDAVGHSLADVARAAGSFSGAEDTVVTGVNLGEAETVAVAVDPSAPLVARARPTLAHSAATTSTGVDADVWHYAVDGSSHGPLTRAALIVELRRLEDLNGVMLWTRGMREWAPTLDFHELATELGVNLRQYARAAISGRAVLKYEGLSQPAPLASIGEGGLGLRVNTELFAGQKVTVDLPADALGSPQTFKAEVRYAAGGVLGLQFTELSGAARGLIATYVRHAARDVARAA